MIVPVPLGEIKLTLIVVALVADTVPIVGGADIVVTVDDEFDATDVPPELVAVTVNAYVVFAVNPVTLIGDDVPVPVKPPGLLATV